MGIPSKLKFNDVSCQLQLEGKSYAGTFIQLSKVPYANSHEVY